MLSHLYIINAPCKSICCRVFPENIPGYKSFFDLESEGKDPLLIGMYLIDRSVPPHLFPSPYLFCYRRSGKATYYVHGRDDVDLSFVMWGALPAGKDLNTVGKDPKHLASAIQEKLGEGEVTCSNIPSKIPIIRADRSAYRALLSRIYCSSALYAKRSCIKYC